MLLRQLCLLICVSSAVVLSRRGGSGSSRGHSRSRSRTKFTSRVSKVGSIERTSLFRATVFGAAAGYLTYGAGRHIVNSPDEAMMFEKRSYYWDPRFYTPTEELPTQCSHKLDPQDPQFGRVYFADNSRPTEIVYGCKEKELCCGFDCCKDNTFFTSLFSLLVLILVLSVLAIFFIECFRWAATCLHSCRQSRSRRFEPLSICK